MDGGYSNYAIKVEVCIEHYWRGICFPGDFEDPHEVIVACRQLGLPTDGNAKTIAMVINLYYYYLQIGTLSSDVYGIAVTSSDEPGTHAVDILECSGDEDRLTDCPYLLMDTCNTFYVGVLCIQGIHIML